MTLNPEIISRFSYELDEFQTNSAIAIEQGHHVLVTSHTGSGKSTVAEYAIAKAFLENKRVFYTSPIKTLSNQKYAEFKKKFGDGNIGIQTGDVKLNPDARCLIMTTEILRNMLFRGDTPLDDLAYVVFDEVHYINDHDRGQVWEESILTMPSHVIMVMLSATMANPEDFARWIHSIKPEREVRIYSTLKRPVPLYFSMMVPNPSTFDENLPWNDAIKEGHMQPILDGERGTFQVAHYNAMVKRYQHFVSHVFDESKHQLAKQALQQLQRKKLDFDMLSMLNKFLNFLHINQQVPAILFTLSRKKCDMYAQRVEVNMINHEERREIENIFDFHIRKLPNHEQYQQVINTKQWLMKGVAVHHSGLLPILKEIVEIIFSKGLIKVLFATETFAIGINMPTKTVVFLDVTKNNGTLVRPLYVEEFKQMAGRAGRRGLDTLGHVIYFPVADPLSSQDMQNMMQGAIHKISSKFAASTHYVLRGICARTSHDKPSIYDITTNTLMHAEYLSHEKGYVLQLDQKQESMSALQERIQCADPMSKYRDIVTKIEELQHKMTTAAAKSKKQLQRDIDDIKDSLSKSEQRTLEQVMSVAKQMHELRHDISRLEKDIELAPLALKQDIEQCVAFLESYKYMVPPCEVAEHVTPRGVFANEISQCHEVMLTEVLMHPSLQAYKDDPGSLAVILSMFLDDKEDTEDVSLFDLVGRSLGTYLYEVIERCEKVQRDLEKYGIANVYDISTRYVGPVQDWCHGAHFEEICKTYQLFEGNVIRSFQRLVNLLDELHKGYEAIQQYEWVQAIDKVKEMVVRDILVTDSIYLTY